MLVVGVLVLYYSAVLLLTGQSVLPFPIDTSPQISAQSEQWAGYVARSSLLTPKPTVTNVSGSWTVPAIPSTSEDTFSGVWVGIGGFGESTLIQAGTLQQCADGRVTYYAWYEHLPALAVRITDLHVSPGDIILASISLVDEAANTWFVEINDVTKGESFEKTLVYNSSRLSGEWIVERPSIRQRVSNLSDFGSVTFFECYATVGNTTGAIADFPRYKLDMYTSENVHIANTSSLSSDGSSFTVTRLLSQGARNPQIQGLSLYSHALVVEYKREIRHRNRIASFP
jgi:hypothetical protein